jgi:hypothetical protein
MTSDVAVEISDDSIIFSDDNMKASNFSIPQNNEGKILNDIAFIYIIFVV